MGLCGLGSGIYRRIGAKGLGSGWTGACGQESGV